ncbi:MAG: ABC transporter substrate-binding protein, partial [Nitratireductor sp.]
MLALATLAGPRPALAEDIGIGTVGLPVSMDPLFAIDTASLDYSQNVYEALLTYDANLNVQPLLAVSWEQVNDTSWEFRLRQGVRFHNGSELRASDVVASLKRASKAIEGSSSPITHYFADVKDIVATSDHSVRVIGEKPIPLFPYSMNWVAITPAAVAEMASNDDFNSGKLALGTGPYKLVSFRPNDSLVLERNADYWGGAQPWGKVTFKLIQNPGARVAALLAGDVDMINAVPPQDIPRLQANENISLHQKVTDRLIYIL